MEQIKTEIRTRKIRAAVSAVLMVFSLTVISTAMLFGQSADGQFMGPPPDGSAPGVPPDGQMKGPPPGGMMDTAPELTGVITADGSNSKAPVDVTSKAVSTDKSDECVVLACHGGAITATGSQFKKSGDTTNMDQSNFYALNAAVVASSKGTVSLEDVVIDTDSEGSNALFATGEGSSITAHNIMIHTRRNSSRGLDATLNGTVTADTVDITTEGAHCAALATDRGEGTIVVNGGKAATAGDGSPVIYSTGSITASNLTGTATGAEIAAIEGKNSITITGCDLTGSGDHGIMLYQSFSGDAGVGTSVLTAKDCHLTSTKPGPFFYVTNTTARVELSGSTLSWPQGSLISASGNDGARGWGRTGSNGGNLTFVTHNQDISGDVICDKISTVVMEFDEGTVYTGAVDTADTGLVSVSLSADAVWTVTADCHVSALSDADGTFGNINSCGYTIYYDASLKGNSSLDGKSYLLSGGGKLTPEKI